MLVLLFYLGLGALLTLEEAGVFLLPGDISLVAAGLHASPHRSLFLLSWLAASAGMVVGASILFHGVSKTKRFDRVLPQRVRSLVRKHGVWGVAVARLVPGLRNATVFAAASANMRYRHFAYGLVPAAVLWSGALLLLGWLGGQAILVTFGQFHDSPVLKMLGLGVLFLIILFVWWRLRGEGSKHGMETPSP